jgi:two-component sensor histidine kinase
VPLSEAGLVGRVFSSGRPATEEVQRWGNTAPMVRQLHPIPGPSGNTIAVVTVETNLIEHERHRRRHVNFRRALAALQRSALRAELPGVDYLMPFGEQDGIVFVDEQRRIRYVSGIATNFYRRLGYMERLVDRHLDILETGDDALISKTLSQGRCLREEAAGQEREWIRQSVPIFAPPGLREEVLRRLNRDTGGDRVIGAFLLVHDETEKRRRQRELQVKSAMIQETHHRVKNNLQTIAALLRMEARRSTSPEARRVLEESMNRILSISVVHEFMANQGDSPINLREVGQRLIAHLRQVLAYPDRQITLSVSGPDIYLPAQQATVCSLVINELVQNAAEHGFTGRSQGSVHLRLSETTDRVVVEVQDDGVGLPPDFELNRSGSMGLNIVQVLVRDDLKGEVKLVSGDGVTATVTFPKPRER